MKLNPFSKKSNPYLDKIKSEHDALNLELAPLKAELAEAEAEHAAAREKQNRLRDAAGSLSMNTPPAHRRIGSFLAIKQYGGRERAAPLPTEPETGLPVTTPVTARRRAGLPLKEPLMNHTTEPQASDGTRHVTVERLQHYNHEVEQRVQGWFASG